VKRSQLSVILSMFAVFCSGIAVGAYGYHSYTAKTVAATGKPPLAPEEWRKRYVEEVRTRVHLDDSQVVSLNSILDETKARFKSVKDRQKQEQKQETDRIRAEQNEKVRAMLKPEQRPEYDSFREERERRMKEQAAKNEAEKKQQTGK
jgi:hypothetical protein